ncbi:MAG TPA: hypothetical protein ENK37_11350 [Oceanithermus profundus]|uniref:Uncharacterized protein n=1 Tax=Oceanithermus profundus TaxID=187137 RepID=A0A7C4V794_9DEIN|nr:hypothetical protein [Oceanithermus profundus]
MRNALWLAFLLLITACRAAAPANPPADPPPNLPADGSPSGPPQLGEVRVYATLHSAGFEWAFRSDPEARATCGLKYRTAGEAAWREA